MRKFSIVLTVIILLLVFSSTPRADAAYSFSSQGYDDVLAAASSNYSGTGLTRNALAAMMLAVTWPEVNGGNSSSPSPMAMSRADNQEGLWSFKEKKESNVTRRAFWHPGIGVFQLDSAGLGSPLGIHQRIDISTAAPVVALSIAGKYRNATGTAAVKRSAAWSSWYACNNNACEKIFNSIYNSSNDTITITRDSSVTRTGGMVAQTCAFTYAQGTTFQCYEINPDRAQGYTAIWRDAYNKNGSTTTSTSPLSLTLTTFVRNGKEERHWLMERTGYNRDVYATRTLNNNARSTLSWSGYRSVCVNGYCGTGPIQMSEPILEE